ncbi:N-acetyltransferase [Psychromonas marina]|uniref:N-acetyltransferase n=1 Tax=Psychromonas marina TaxID=88364 RepID=A0ABQ6E2D6_9GAMM|nr:GNAT family N-acetyltransferase [Psychromonas marina]GLS91370.1 N-acetyltransferase [Psychromonas marina]
MYTIKLDDLCGEQIITLLEEHLADMQATSPPESKHALDLSGLKSASVKFWTIWDSEILAGCGAYQQLDAAHAEIKSMRTATAYKGKGVASRLLKHLIEDAKLSGYQKISLETGSMDYFKPAHALYKKHGFVFCSPFADYVEDVNSQFMTLNLP